MTRLIQATPAERVEVRRRDDVPEQFVWRGRRYVVAAVLARWTESGCWWRAAGTAGSVSAAGPSTAGPDDGEREWWRVEAGSGRRAGLSGGTGVYDLCFDWGRGTWSLARVAD